MPRETAEDLIERIEDQLDSGYAAGALDLSSFAVRRFPADPDLWALYAEALEGAGRLKEAVDAYARAIVLTPDWTAGVARKASLLIELGEVDAARRDVDAVLATEPNSSEAQFNRAILAEIDGNEVDAARAYRTAENLDPERYYLPVRVSSERFLDAAREAIDELPARLRVWLHQAAVIVRDMPERDAEGAWEGGPNPLLFAYVAGPEIPEGDGVDPWDYVPDAVVLFKKNLERVCGSVDDLIRELTVTLFHEALYYLRVPEDDVADPPEDPADEAAGGSDPDPAD